jgi:hypothetical protein
MNREKIETMLEKLGRATEGCAAGELGAKIKGQIPEDLRPHRKGMDSINIIIDLRVGRLAAAAAILGAAVLFGALFGGRDPVRTLYQDGKVLVEYITGANKPTLAGLSARIAATDPETGDEKGFLYGERRRSQDSNDLLMHWRLDQDRYRVVFIDMRTDTVNSEELIKIQSRMIRRMTKD